MHSIKHIKEFDFVLHNGDPPEIELEEEKEREKALASDHNRIVLVEGYKGGQKRLLTKEYLADSRIRICPQR